MTFDEQHRKVARGVAQIRMTLRRTRIGRIALPILNVLACIDGTLRALRF